MSHYCHWCKSLLAAFRTRQPRYPAPTTEFNASPPVKNTPVCAHSYSHSGYYCGPNGFFNSNLLLFSSSAPELVTAPPQPRPPVLFTYPANPNATAIAIQDVIQSSRNDSKQYNIVYKNTNRNSSFLCRVDNENDNMHEYNVRSDVGITTRTCLFATREEGANL